MIDVVGLAVDALQRRDVAKLPVVALAGALTSVGPCVAPRYLALAAFAPNAGRLRTTLSFVAGLVTAYALIGFGGGVLAALIARTSLIDALLAIVLIAAGAFSVIAPPPTCHHRDAAASTPASAPFVLGSASALVVSPCCTPVVAATVGLSAVDRQPLTSAAFLAVFALGHAAPLVFGGGALALCARPLVRWAATGAPATVGGTLLIALGAYYAVQVI